MPHCQSRIEHDNHTPIHGVESPVLMRRETAVTDCDGIPKVASEIALCLTVYNEPAEALWSSLAGLAAALGEVRATHVRPATVVIIVDGLSQAAPSMLQALAELVGAEEFAKSSGFDLACHHRSLDLARLAAQFPGGANCPSMACSPQGGNHPPLSPAMTAGVTGHGGEVHILVAIKNENAGKLDSHWWFYRILCPCLSPRICFQMDIGTCPSANAFCDVIDEFDSKDNVGAVATSILPAKRAGFLRVLHSWQYFSFSNAMLLEWPAESASGFLSVVPGQLSAFRWEAIQDPVTIEPATTRDTPLDVYFRGLGYLSPAESMLYLAEDRVLCRELVAIPDADWMISHVDQAMAVTDPCDSWPELLRQRKRWCNGYIACRVNYLKGLPGLLFRQQGSAQRKSQASLAGLYHTLVLVHDWFTPAISYLLMFFLATGAMRLLAGYPYLQLGSEVGSWLTLVAVLCQFVVCLRGKLRPGSVNLLRMAIGLQLWLVGLALFVNLLFAESKLLIYVFGFLLLVGPTAALVAHRRLAAGVFLNTPLALLAEYVVPPLLWTYAVCNAHDSSWGTKGLLRNARHIRPVEASDQKQTDSFRTFKNRYLFAWLTTNIMVAAVFMLQYADDSSAAIVTLLSVDACSLLFGLLCTVQKTLSRAGRAHAYSPDNRPARSH